MTHLTDEQLKQAIVSVLIGAAVAFITTLLQGVIQWLQHIDYVTGPVAGVSYYVTKTWNRGHLG